MKPAESETGNIRERSTFGSNLPCWLGSPADTSPSAAGGITKNLLTSLVAVFLFSVPSAIHAQLTYTTNSGTITITGYTGSGAAVTIPRTINGYPVTTIGDYAFANRTSLRGIYFQGNAPGVGTGAFQNDSNTTIYYLPGTTGWTGFVAYWGLAFYQRVPAVLWNPQPQTNDGHFGVRTNRFGFTIVGTAGLVVVVEACADLASPAWVPVGTNTLTGGMSYFGDPDWVNYPSRVYRLRSP